MPAKTARKSAPTTSKATATRKPAAATKPAATKTPKAPKTATAPKSKTPTTRKPDPARAKLAARVVKLRDEDKKSWKEIAQITKQNPGQLRKLVNLGRKIAAKS
jgi:hypothetical protein